MSRTTNRTICDVTAHLNDGALRICSLIGDIEAEVHFGYEPGEREMLTRPNGDPGEPGYPPSVHIEKVITTKECTLYGDGCKLVIEPGVDVREYLSLRQIDDEEGDILEWLEQKWEYERGEAMIDAYIASREAA